MKKDEFIEGLTTLLESKKAENIDVVNMKNSNYFVDFVIVATTLNDKHSYALRSFVEEYVKQKGESVAHSESSDDWTVIDLGDKLIHLMSDEQRKIYKIEEFLKKYIQNKEENS